MAIIPELFVFLHLHLACGQNTSATTWRKSDTVRFGFGSSNVGNSNFNQRQTQKWRVRLYIYMQPWCDEGKLCPHTPFGASYILTSVDITLLILLKGLSQGLNYRMSSSRCPRFLLCRLKHNSPNSKTSHVWASGGKKTGHYSSVQRELS